MKKIVSICCALLMTISLAACSKPQNETPKTDDNQPVVSADVEKSADVIIIGAGGAGLSAAIQAVESGAKSVIIVEKTNNTGGSLNYTSGSMSGAETIIQELDGIEDTKESFVQDILKNGAHKGNEELIRKFVDEDVDMIQWLWDHGLSDNQFSTDKEGHRSVFAPEHALYSVPRTYKASPDNKEKYKSAAHEILDTVVAGLDNVTIDFVTEAKTLLPNDKGQILSVLAVNNETSQTVKYTAEKGIIVATGGYSGNAKLMGEFAENGASYLAGGSFAADGYGIRMMQEVGAKVDEETMTYIPTFPMGLEVAPGIGSIAPTYTWKAGGICVNKNGERFVDETLAEVEEREVALEEQPEAIQYDIFTDKIIEDLKAAGADMMWTYLYEPENGKGHSKVVTAESIEELAGKLNMPAEQLAKTVEEYNAAVEAGGTDSFGRSYDGTVTAYNVAVNKIEGDKYYAVPLKALVVMTLGGVTVNDKMQVLAEDGTVIPGLYAAGEVTGGIWGRFVSGGTGVMGPIVFGRLAARELMSGELAEGYTAKPASNLLDENLFVRDEADKTDRFDMSKALTDGEYEASVDGQEGKMNVKTTIADGKISKVEIVEQHETEAVAKPALESLPTAIAEQNSVNVDTVAGATLTSNRILDAVTDCLNQAAK